MNSNATLFVAMPFGEFVELIQTAIKDEFKNLSFAPSFIEPENLLSIDEAGALLHVSKVTIHKWKRNKYIHAYRIGRKIYFKREELIKAIYSSAVDKKK